ncbi:hypothetical protein FOA43_003450 [Brettanomyces nanus]|uniref:Pre-rRNA-processing protein IPI3 n=1 Tax=Eeniella nana TaxID=13502 RepID=A0A875SAT0_EENNA|nr:uncharacterized protein FOA43_003450 [Brettanomyces nanus]QPG76064.1 hypothetical protein FOA43_003450 [Brettanomyces nanus]
MDEIAFYCCSGDATDKHDANSFAYLSSLHSSKQYLQYRQCYSGRNGSVLTGIGQETKLISACNDRAIIQVYLYGKESPEQKIPIPEPLSCLEICDDWLLVGGGQSGRIYVWELDSGLLLAVKECHYQAVNVIRYNKGFLVSGGADSRVVIWRILDLANDSINPAKPYSILTDNTLPVTDLVITNGLVSDLKVYTASRDCTVRCYSIASKRLITTFVLPTKVESLAADPAYRALYAGQDDGFIRMIPLYRGNVKTHVLEAVGGMGSIVTLKPDLDLQETFVCHKDDGNGQTIVTKLQVTLDGTYLVSGDSKGNVFVVDIATKQIQRKFKPLAGAVSQILLAYTKADNKQLDRHYNDKNMVRVIPTLKRVVVDANAIEKHEIQKKLGELQPPYFGEQKFDMNRFLEDVKTQQMWFTNLSDIDSTVIRQGSENLFANGKAAGELTVLKTQLEQKNAAYTTLKEKYEQLYKEHINGL